MIVKISFVLFAFSWRSPRTLDEVVLTLPEHLNMYNWLLLKTLRWVPMPLEYVPRSLHHGFPGSESGL